MSARTRRRWRKSGSVVGLVSCADVQALQTRIHDYRTDLQTSVTAWQTAVSSTTPVPAGQPLPGMPIHDEVHSVQTWADLVSRCDSFEHESCGLLDVLFAGSQYDRGRGLVTELDEWRDWLAAQRAAASPEVQRQWTVPAPVEVPSSDVSVLGGLAWAAAAVIAILVLREFH